MSQIRDGTSNDMIVGRGSGSGSGRGSGSGGGQSVYAADLSINPQDPVRRGTQTAIPIPITATSGRSAATRSVTVRNGGAQPQPAPNASAVVTGEVQDLLEVVQPLNRPAAQPANPTGNRLNVNRVDNAAGLVTESRDPTRQNAIIHKSYIKK